MGELMAWRAESPTSSSALIFPQLIGCGRSDRTVVRNDCRLVCGSVSNVHCIRPLLGRGGFGSPGLTSIVTVPVHPPARKEVGVDGPVGLGEPSCGALGVLFAQAGIGLLRPMAPVELPRVNEIGIDGMVLVFTLTISVVTAFMFGHLSALRLGRVNFPVLKNADRAACGAPGRHRTQNTLVGAG